MGLKALSEVHHVNRKTDKKITAAVALLFLFAAAVGGYRVNQVSFDTRSAASDGRLFYSPKSDTTNIASEAGSELNTPPSNPYWVGSAGRGVPSYLGLVFETQLESTNVMRAEIELMPNADQWNHTSFSIRIEDDMSPMDYNSSNLPEAKPSARKLLPSVVRYQKNERWFNGKSVSIDVTPLIKQYNAKYGTNSTALSFVIRGEDGGRKFITAEESRLKVVYGKK
jgi:hypothetical protein